MAPLVHLAIASFQPKKADYRANLARLADLLEQVDALQPRPDVLCLPESALTGYFLEGGVRDVAVTAGTLARDLQAAYRSRITSGETLDVMLGFYEVWRNRLFNSAMYVTLGGAEPVVHHVHRKVFLPTYGLFDEERFVERGRDVRAFDTPWGKAAILICEDVWHSVTASIAALDGAQIIFVPSAPPVRGAWPRQDDTPGPATIARWERLMREAADEHGVYLVFAPLSGGEAGKMFAGQSFVAGPRGDIRARADLWDETLLTVTVDLKDITRARADMPLVADLETMMPHLMTTLARIEQGVPHTLEYDAVEPAAEFGLRAADTAGGATEATPRSGDPQAAARSPKLESRPAVRSPQPAAGSDARSPKLKVISQSASDSAPHPLEIDAALVEEWLVMFIRDEMARRNFPRAVVGVSGGVDSAVTAYLAAKAIGPQNVLGLRMPYRTSSPDSLADAQLIIDALGIDSRTLDISAAVDGYLTHEPDADGTRRGNVMARVRMITLFDQSAKLNAIPLGTGNKTERLFGYFTWHADDTPPINPLGDLFKTQVWALARHLGIPEQIVGKPPSADLVVGQTDEGDFGISYARADEILNWLLSGYTTDDLRERGFDEGELRVVERRLAGTHWKRRLPTVAMISSTAIGEAYLRPVDY